MARHSITQGFEDYKFNFLSIDEELDSDLDRDVKNFIRDHIKSIKDFDLEYYNTGKSIGHGENGNIELVKQKKTNIKGALRVTLD